MADLVIEKINEVYLKVKTEPSIEYELRDRFTFEVPNKKFMPQYRSRYWDGYVHLFNMKTKRIYVGLLDKIVAFCENNGYSEYTATDEIAAGDILDRARAFGIEAHKVDGQDVLAVNKLATDLIARARKGEGPFFIELITYRYHGHHVGDINRTYYRSKEEEENWKKNKDPIKILGDWLVSEKISTEEELQTMRDEIAAEANDAVQYALEANYPNANEVDMHVYLETN